MNIKNLVRYFTTPNRNISHHQAGSLFFDIDQNGSDVLLVTIGDSWTWGDELSTRVDDVYGNLLAKKLSADWLNLGIPGIGNFYISTLYQELVNFLKVENNNYKQVWCVITLTEVAREFDGHWDQTVDYSTWLQNNINCVSDYYNFLRFVETVTCDNLSTPAPKNLKTFVAWNFVDKLQQNIHIQHTLLEHTWLEVCMDDCGQQIQDTCYFVSPYIIDKLKLIPNFNWSLNTALFDQWLHNQVDLAIRRITYLENPKYFYHRLHPNRHSHQIWAEYVYKAITLECR